MNEKRHPYSTDPLTGRPLKPTMGELLRALVDFEGKGVCLHLTPGRQSQGSDVAIAWSQQSIESWLRIALAAFPLDKPQYAVRRLMGDFIASKDIAIQAELLAGQSRVPIIYDEDDFADSVIAADEDSSPYRNDIEPKALLKAKSFETTLCIPSKSMILIHASVEWDGLCAANPCLLFAQAIDKAVTPLWSQGAIVESPKALIAWSDYVRRDVIDLARMPEVFSLLSSAMVKAELQESARAVLPDQRTSRSI